MADTSRADTSRRARPPDLSGEVVRGGVSIHYDVYGDGPTTVVLLPAWSIVDSRMWKAQVPFLARHYRVVTFDGRGSGRSDRPPEAADYQDREYVADAVAVLDATGTQQCVLVGFSRGAEWAVRLTAAEPDRVRGIFAIAPSCALPAADFAGQRALWQRRSENPQGWRKYSAHHWRSGGLADFREFFFAQMFPEPHSSKQIEDMLAWSAEIDAQTLCHTTAARLDPGPLAAEPFSEAAESVRCPVHVVHGTADTVSGHAVGEQLAELTGGSITLVEGAGHGVITRDPVRVNTLLRGFIDSVTPSSPRRANWTRAARRPRRVLYLSSPIGLGHARRDLAIANELRRNVPEIDLMWLAQSPVTKVLAAAGERLHPASRHLLGESAHIESEAGEHDLHAFEAIRRMDTILIANFMVFAEMVADYLPDLVIADEAWEVDYFLHENPELKRFQFAWLTDFVGWLPMPDGGRRERALTADYNAEIIEQRARFPWVRDRSIFVGEPNDIVPHDFGAGLPGIREWTENNFEFSGYVMGSPPPDGAERAALRGRLGVGPDDRLCVVTVGGTGVGNSLLGRVVHAVPIIRRMVPELGFVVVTGPRIDPASVPRVPGVTVCGYVDDLADYLAACDIAVVQGGLTTCMELTAAGTPFVYVPLDHHFEQNFHVSHRLDRYAAGRRMCYAEAADPHLLAQIIVEEMSADRPYRPVETDGAQRAAQLLTELL